MFRLGLLNPNTDERHTVAMREVALGVLPGGCDVIAVTAERGPSSIESDVDSVVAAAQVVTMVGDLSGLDAYLVACFGDPGLEAARELTVAPVVGIGEAAFQAAAMIAKRFGIITTLPRGAPALEDALAQKGIQSRCVGVASLDIPVADQGSHNPGTTLAIVEAGRSLVNGLGAEALVLACGAMADVAKAVEDGVGVPVCDGVAFGAMTAYSLWRCGLSTSKIGAYGWPERIPYVGMPSPGIPQGG